MRNLFLFAGRLTSVILLIAAMGIAGGCSEDSDDDGNNNNSGGGTNNPPANQVLMNGSSFSPATINVTVGTTVTWTNKDGMSHTVTSNSGVFDSGTISNNGVYSYTFNTAGTFPYFCILHPGMTGSVIVSQ